WMPLAYSRLWLLTAFAAAAVLAFRAQLMGRVSVRGGAVAAVSILALLQASASYWSYRSRPADRAVRLEIAGEEYRRHLGLIAQSPSLGSRRTVFSYCALLDNRYRIFTQSGQPWGLPSGRNYFSPSLAQDDSSLLVETVVGGRSEIWLSSEPGGTPRLVVEGQSPAWHPGGSFAFERGGRLHLYDLETGGQTALEATEGGYDAAFSPDGEWLLFCGGRESPRKARKLGERARKGGIWRVRVDGGSAELLYEADGCSRPRMSSDGRRVLFSLGEGGNQDIWMLNLASQEALRLTSNPAIDRDPLWDEERNRILFTSDRGRGLGCTTLFWMPIASK
ncbi:MAG: hypothetical protein V3T83_19975, partial [Acidobacteriota bacterium]